LRDRYAGHPLTLSARSAPPDTGTLSASGGFRFGNESDHSMALAKVGPIVAAPVRICTRASIKPGVHDKPISL